MMVNIYANLFLNPSGNDKVIDRTRNIDPIFDLLPQSVTVASEPRSCVVRATRCLLMDNISAK